LNISFNYLLMNLEISKAKEPHHLRLQYPLKSFLEHCFHQRENKFRSDISGKPSGKKSRRISGKIIY